MPDSTYIPYVSTFQDLVSIPFHDAINALCWQRELPGDFSEIVQKFEQKENITVISPDDLLQLNLTDAGDTARRHLLEDLNLLESYGASPVLNLIRHYERDDNNDFFPTDVYSFHADRSPVPTDTFLCTYYGTTSEFLPNSQVYKKVLIPEIRQELKKRYAGPEDGFDSFLEERCLDLHYEPKAGAVPIRMGQGQLWRLAVDYPGSPVLPCVHRAPVEKSGQCRLLLIC